MPDTNPILDDIAQCFDLPQAPAVFAGIAPHEPFLATTWNRYRAIMLGGEIEAVAKQLMGMAVAIAKSNNYMIAIQKQVARQAGVGEDGILEALAVVEFFEGFDGFALALRVDSELRPRKLAAGDFSLVDREIDVNVPYVLEPGDARVREVYEEIKQAMRIPFVPNIFKALAHQPAMLRAKWDAYRAIMMSGGLRRLTKELIAVAVSAVNGCFY